MEEKKREMVGVFLANHPIALQVLGVCSALDVATKLETELGWKAQENFESGLEKTVARSLDNDWWWRPLRKQYGGERLGILPTQAQPAAAV